MGLAKITTLFIAVLLHSVPSQAQDTAALQPIPAITKIPLKFITQTNKKIDKYTNRITSKTEKTLEKLARWEEKVRKLLEKTSPETVQQLFGEGRQTFASMLAKIKEGKSLAENTKARYNDYNDKLTTNIKYLETQKEKLNSKYIAPIQKAKQKITQLEKDVATTETAEKLIQERKKELLTQAYKVLGKNRYISKMQQECFYFGESLQNYKQLFSEPGKAEQKALELLGKLPAVQEFVKNNSMLASLFGNNSSSANAANTASLAGLQTRASVNSLIQNRIAAGGPNAAAQISANMQAAQAELTKLKDKILKQTNGNGASTVDAQDGLPSFKKKELKSKTFKQRLELGSNIQFGKPNRYTSSQADMGMSIGYKVNDKSIVGIGFSYKLNYGSINNFYVQHGGFSLRSGYDVKLFSHRGGARGGGFFISSGFELNYNQAFKNFSEIRNAYGTTGIGNALQSSALIGLSKKIKFSSAGGKTKWIKGTKIQLLYDMLYNTHVVPTQAVQIRIGQIF